MTPKGPHGLVLRGKMHFRRGVRGRKCAAEGEKPAAPQLVAGGIPRISRLMALAIRFDRLIREGAVRDYADLARLGHVTRARVTQVMNLLDLAPEIQEAILFLPRTASGRDGISERQVRRVATEPDWQRQRRLYESPGTSETA
jgi:hypothetical protein